MPIYIANKVTYNIPEDEVQDFLNDFPNAKEVENLDELPKKQEPATEKAAAVAGVNDMALQQENGSLESPPPSGLSRANLIMPSFEEQNNIKEDLVPTQDIFDIVNEQVGDDLQSAKKNMDMVLLGDQYFKDFDEKVLNLKEKEILSKGQELKEKYNVYNDNDLEKAQKEYNAFQSKLIEEARATSNSYQNRMNTYGRAFNEKLQQIQDNAEIKAEKENEEAIKLLGKQMFGKIGSAILPDSVEKGLLKMFPMIGQAIDLGAPIFGALNQFDEGTTFAEKSKQLSEGKGYTTRKNGTVDVVNISGGIKNYATLNDAIEDYNNKANEKFATGVERFISSEKYQKAISAFGKSPEILDGIQKGEFGEILGTQAGQMALAAISLGTSTYAQEAGNILKEITLAKAEEKYPDYNNKTEEEKKDIILDIVKNGEIDFSQIEKSGTAIAALDLASTAFGAGKIAKAPIGSMFRNLAKKNYKGAVKAAKGELKEVGSATLFEIPTEVGQEAIGMVETSEQLGEDTFNFKQLAEAGAQALISTGPLIGGGRVINRGTRKIAREAQGGISSDVKAQEDAIKILFENGSISKKERDNQLTSLYEAENIANNANYKNFEPEAREEMFDIQVEQQTLANKNKEIDDQYVDLNTVYGEGQKQRNQNRIAELENKKQEVIAKQTRLFMGDNLRQYINNNPEKFDGFQYISFNTTQEAKEYLENKGVDLTQENIAGLINGDVYGVKIPQIKTIVDVKETLANPENNLAVGANVVHHEGLHALTNSLDDASIIKIAKDLGSTLQKVNDPTLVSIGALSQERVDNDYSNATARIQAEEFISSVSDYMRTYQVAQGDVPTATALSNFGSKLAEILNVGDLDLDLSGLENGAEVLTWLKKYNSYNGKPTLNLKLPTPKRATEVPEEKTTSNEVAASKVVENVTFEEGSINNEFQNYTYDGKVNNAPESFQAEAAMAYEPLAQAVVDRISKVGLGVSKDQDQFIIDYLSDNQNKQDIVSDLTFGTERNKASSLLGLAKTYNPEVGSFGGYAKSQLANRAIRILEERVGKQVTQGAQTLDVPESRQIISEEKEIKGDIRSIAEQLNLPKELVDKSFKLAELAAIKADKTLQGKEVSDLKKINARNKAFNDLFSKQLFKDIANELGKNTKNSNDFSKYLNKNFEFLTDVALENIDFQKGSGPAALWNIDNPPSKEEFIDYYEAKNEQASTRSDRKKSLNNAIARSLANDARIEFAKNDPATAQAFKEKHGVVLASKIVIPENAPQELNYKDIKALLKDKKITYDYLLNTTESIDEFFEDMQPILNVIPADMVTKALLRPTPRIFKKGIGDVKGRKSKDAEEIAYYNKINNYYNKKLNAAIKEVKQKNKNKLEGPAAGYVARAFEKMGLTEAEIAKNWDNGYIQKENEKNIAMHKQMWKPLYNAIADNPKSARAVGWLMMRTSDAGATHWHRMGAEMVGYSTNPKGSKKGLYIYEHAMQAKNAYLFLIDSALNNIPFEKAYNAMSANYKVIALDRFQDAKLTSAKYGELMPAGWNVYKGSWTERYFNPQVAVFDGGIPTESIVNFVGQTMADKYKIDAAGKSTRVMASKTLDQDFNKMLERVKGVKADARYSEDRANKLAADKGRFKFFVPYSAEDFVGLIYPTLGKGKEGDRNLQWYKENLLDPYAIAINQFEAAKVKTLQDWRNLKKKIKKSNVPLGKDAVRGFSNEEALRVYFWNEQNVAPDTLAKKDIQALVNHVESTPELLSFANSVKDILGGQPYPAPQTDWIAGSLTIDLIDNVNTVKRADFLKDWKENVDVVYSKDNMNKLKAIYGKRYTEALQNILYRMETGRNRPVGANRLENQFMNWVNDSVGTIMFFNTRSALLQTISAVNFLNFTDNNPIRAAAAFANQKQFWSDFSTLMNSDFLKSRRSGLKNDVNADEIANAAASSTNKVKAALSAILKVGFTPTQIADSFAIAIGGASFYRNRIDKYKKEGLSEQEAEQKAMLDFQETAEESQQSSRPDRVSMQQASGLGRVILAFANTPMQYTRLMKKATLDLVNGRGDWKTNMSKILYYGAVQNIIFTALQKALIAALFDDDVIDNEEEERIIGTIANSSADTILRGTGVGGAAVATIKNIILEAINQYKSKRKDYTKAALESFTLSPPIDSKIGKLMSAGRKFQYKQELEAMRTKGVAIDNPALLAFGQVLSATANLPLDRAIIKLNNIKKASDTEFEMWQRIGFALGYNEWDLGLKKKKKDDTKKPKSSFKTTTFGKSGFKTTPLNKKENLPDGVLGKAHKDGTIQIRKGLSPAKRKEVIAHEKKHAADMKSGRLNYDSSYVYWDGKAYPRLGNQKILYKGKALLNGHKSLPWEKRANGLKV